MRNETTVSDVMTQTNAHFWTSAPTKDNAKWVLRVLTERVIKPFNSFLRDIFESSLVVLQTLLQGKVTFCEPLQIPILDAFTKGEKIGY